MRRSTFSSSLLFVAFVLAFAPLPAEEASSSPAVYPTALFPFRERGEDLTGVGEKTSDLLFAHLATHAEMYLVDREDLNKTLSEYELNLSGVVKPEEATEIGHLTGAKLLVTGSAIQVESDLYLVAKIIGTETSRVLGASVKGKLDGNLNDLARELAEQVGEIVRERGEQLVAEPDTREDRLTRLKNKLDQDERPPVLIDVSERHLGQPPADPAAQTELLRFCRETGFELVDPEKGNRSDAEVLLTGVGFSEFAARHGDLVSVKARLEVKAVDSRTGRILAVERQTSVAIDLTEQIAGKAALQQAAAEIAERLLPEIVKQTRGTDND